MVFFDYCLDDSLRYEELFIIYVVWDFRGFGIGLFIEFIDVNFLRLSLIIMIGFWWESFKIIFRMFIFYCVFITKNKIKICYLDIFYRKDIRK